MRSGIGCNHQQRPCEGIESIRFPVNLVDSFISLSSYIKFMLYVSLAVYIKNYGLKNIYRNWRLWIETQVPILYFFSKKSCKISRT